LEKEQTKRYASCAALADDLHRFVSGDPIKARPTGVIERLWRWGHRRPAAAGLAATLLVIPLLLITILMWSNREIANSLEAEKDARQVAQAKTIEAEEQRREAQANALEANHSKRTAQAKAIEAEQRRAESRLNLYVVNLQLAQRTWQDRQVSSVLELLDEARQGLPGDKDLRSRF
jgi:hypothetical protein